MVTSLRAIVKIIIISSFTLKTIICKKFTSWFDHFLVFTTFQYNIFIFISLSNVLRALFNFHVVEGEIRRSSLQIPWLVALSPFTILDIE